MNNKTLSIVSYITLIGWLIAYFVGKEKADDLLKYHLRQSFSLIIVNIVLGITVEIITAIVPTLAGIISLIYFILLILWVIGIINAYKSLQKPLPIIGEWANKTFTFIR